MPVLIAEERDRYINCLKAADDAESRGLSDTSEMAAFLTEILTRQLEAALPNQE